jgi:hypothetical protein
MIGVLESERMARQIFSRPIALFVAQSLFLMPNEFSADRRHFCAASFEHWGARLRKRREDSGR